MAKRNSSNQDFNINLDGFDLTAGTAPRKLAVTGGDVTLTGGSASTVYSFPTVANYTRLIGSNSGDNALFTNDVGTYQTTVTAATTTTLTVASPKNQYFTGTTTQTCRLPVASTLEAGTAYEIVNDSTGAVTIQRGDATAFAPALVLAPGQAVFLRCINISNSPGTWDVEVSSTEGVKQAQQYVQFTGDRAALVSGSSTTFNPIFIGANAGGLTAGSLTLSGATTYFFECFLHVTTMSATSGNFAFSLLGNGTATASSVSFFAHGLDNTTQSTGVALGGSAHLTTATGANTVAIITAATGTAAHVFIKGVLRTNAGGTMIPQIALATANAAVVKAGSYFSITKAGPSTQAYYGAWA